ncbi:MAG: putative membrane protein YdjX (TVP38/TMEM64 family) [Bacteriovoracaceae bacterium]
MFKRILIFIILISSFIVINYFDLDRFLNFDYIKANQDQLQSFYQNNKFPTLLIFFLGYVLTTALSIPGATILSLLGGAVFGFEIALVLISFASTIGATLAFLIARTLLRDFIEKHFEETIKRVNEGIENNGGFYLFSMRLVPVLPFFVINSVMGLTKIKISTFFLISQVSMLGGTAIYINAGVQLSELESVEGIMSLELVGSLLLLGIFPFIAKKIMELINA